MRDCDVTAYPLPDLRADDGVRTVWLTARGVRIDRTVCGIKMRVCVPIEAYQAILLTRHNRRSCRLTLAHDDPDLSVRLEGANAEDVWQDWVRLRPALVGIARATPAPRRRNMTLAKRRPRILLRRRPGWAPAKILRAARELFSRE
ncbi:MAG: hypothetical protein ACREC1_00585 [Methylovirgula sp.]